MIGSLALLVVVALAAGCESSPDPRVAPDRRDPAASSEAVVYAALPFRDLAADPVGARDLLDALQLALEARGARFVPAEDLEQILRSRRIRYTDSISITEAREIASATGAEFLLLGAVLSSIHGPSPRISTAVRLIDAERGRPVHSQVVSLRGEDFTGLLGLGTIEDHGELAREVVARLSDGFDPRGRPVALPHPESLTRWRPSNPLSTFLHEGFEPAQMERVAVLPFSVRTKSVTAGLLMAELLSHQLLTSAGVDVVEQSELRAAMRREKVRSVDGIDLQVLRRVGRDLRTRYFVLGSVDQYRERASYGAVNNPEIQASLRIVDVELGHAVAATGLHCRGDDYHTLLGLGTVRDPVTLANRVARSMIAALGG